MSLTVARTLDLKGLSCPLPIVKTSKAVKEMASGGAQARRDGARSQAKRPRVKGEIAARAMWAQRIGAARPRL